MAKKKPRGAFDPALKALVETAPADWLPLLGLPRRRVAVIDADIAAVVSGAGDKVIRVFDDPQYLLHLDFLSGHDAAQAPRKLKLYNGVLEYRHDLPVLSVAVLLRPEANSPQLTGLSERGLPNQLPWTVHRYRVLRVWKTPVAQLLQGGLGTLALAPISDLGTSDLPSVIRQMQQRLSQPGQRPKAEDIWAATYVLLGSRYSKEFARILLQEVRRMRESTTYQAILEEGQLEVLKRLVLKVGRKRFGPPPDETRRLLEGMTNVSHLERLVERVYDVSSWDALLSSGGRGKRSKGSS